MDKNILKQIIIENQELISNIKLTERDLFIEEAGNYVFTGSRRAGKTYCMFQIMKKMLLTGTSKNQILYFNFEDERLLELQADNLSQIIDAYREVFEYKPIIFLDEIQIIEGWEKFVRRLADNGYHLFITGSNAQMLSREIATTLGGRFIIKEIYPFSFKEYLKANSSELEPNWEYSSTRFEIRRLFDPYFYYGGFPEIMKFQEKRIWLNNLYQKIFYGDLIARYKIRNDFALKLMIKKMAESIHDEVSFNRIRNIIQSTGTKISTTTVIEYISYLEETWLMFSLENYHSKITERESQKKYYFIDNGILSLFLTSPETMLLENIIAIQLKRLYGDELYYFRAQTEVDFYLPTQKTLIQACYQINTPETEKRECDALIKASKVIGAEKLIVITLDTEKEIKYEEQPIQFVPVWKWILIN